jgi:hypothetical protein
MTTTPSPEDARAALRAAAEAQASLRQAGRLTDWQIGLLAVCGGGAVAQIGIPDSLAWLRWVVLGLIIAAELILLVTMGTATRIKVGTARGLRQLRFTAVPAVILLAVILTVIWALGEVDDATRASLGWWVFAGGGLLVAAAYFAAAKAMARLVARPRRVDPR